MDPDLSGNLQSEHPPERESSRFSNRRGGHEEHGIGKQGTLSWKLPTDMHFFKTVKSSTSASSKRNAVIMGRHTWESIPEKFRPLPGRLNVILTQSGIITTTPPKGILVTKTFGDALAVLAREPYEEQVESVFVIAGGQVYSFETYVRRSPTKEALPVQSLLSKSVLEAHEEYQYLGLIDDIIKTGPVKGERGP